MTAKRILSLILFLLFFNFSYGQKKFKVEVEETGKWTNFYSLVDEQDQVIKRLDTSIYSVYMGDGQFEYFAIFGRKNESGWLAIDADENVLFKVYNTSFGEPTPDFLVENKIRIIDANESIGFANNKGDIIIVPQFEFATSFHNGKAIIGQTCKNVPLNEHAKESDCQHYKIDCKQYGYINAKGKVIEKGDYSFEQVMKQINWKKP